MIVVIGASGETPPAITFSRKSVSVTMPNSPDVETKSAETCSAVIKLAASRIVRSGRQSTGGPDMRLPIRIVRTSGRPTENVQRRLPFNKVTGGVIVGSNGEGCGHTRQQRWMTKALSGLEDIHHLVLMA